MLASNLDAQVTAEDILQFFNTIGEVKYVRLLNEEHIQGKSALVEFTEQSSVASALQHNGTMLGSSSVKITHANQAIIKPMGARTSHTQQKDIEETMRRVREAQSLITNSLEAPSVPGAIKLENILGLTDQNRQSVAAAVAAAAAAAAVNVAAGNGHSSSGGRRSRSRSKRRSRSRTPTRRRSRSRDRSRRYRERSRSRDRAPVRRTSPAPRNRRSSRSKSPARVKRSRSRERIRRERSRSRSKERRPRYREEVRPRRRSRSQERKDRERELRERDRLREKEKRTRDSGRDDRRSNRSAGSPPPPSSSRGKSFETDRRRDRFDSARGSTDDLPKPSRSTSRDHSTFGTGNDYGEASPPTKRSRPDLDGSKTDSTTADKKNKHRRASRGADFLDSESNPDDEVCFPAAPKYVRTSSDMSD